METPTLPRTKTATFSSATISLPTGPLPDPIEKHAGGRGAISRHMGKPEHQVPAPGMSDIDRDFDLIDHHVRGQGDGTLGAVRIAVGDRDIGRRRGDHRDLVGAGALHGPGFG